MAQDEHVELEGSGRPAVAGTKVAEATGPIDVVVLLRPQTSMPTTDELSDHMARGVDPTSYHTHPDDLALVETFCRDHGFTVSEVHPGARMLRFRGDAAEVAKAFDIDLGVYTDGQRQFLCHEKPVSLPKALDGVVEWVFGLDEAPVLKATSNFGAGALRASTEKLGTAMEGELISYSVPELAEIYDFPAGKGAGACVGIIALSGGYAQSDLDAYFASIGLATPKIWTLAENQPSDPISNYQVVQGIEIAGAVVPEATIALYNNNSGNASVAEFFRVFAAAIHDDTNQPQVLINPWVFTENPVQLPQMGITPQQIKPFEDLFKIAALKGITVCSSSGSMGAMFPVGLVSKGTYPTLTVIQGLALPYPNYPPSSPLNLSVGGTSLYAKGGPRRELVWNRLMNPMSVNGLPYNGGATGGGISWVLPRPDYQAHAEVPVGRSYAWNNGELTEAPSFEGRGLPDVSIDADTFTGYQIYFEGTWGVGGGTGVAVPLWGALVVLLNEAVGRRLGWLNPYLYQLQIDRGQQVFELVAGGSNGAFDAPVDKPWNPCCGLGVPRGKRLAAALVELLGTPSASPGAGAS